MTCPVVQTCYAVGASSVLTSNDGGQTWSETSVGQNLSSVACRPTQSAVCIAVGPAVIAGHTTVWHCRPATSMAPTMITKLLVANRGEIAVRAFRAAYELGVRSVAVYAPEDRDSVHRLKADESYEIGVPGRPVSTYLDVDLVVETAVRVGADAVYPGYGFLAENPQLARACERAKIRFVGPPADVLGLAGDKTRARDRRMSR